MGVKRFGAHPQDWDTLSLIYGLGADLLPVVSNLSATISSRSSLKTLGKTPSQYNASRQVAGLKIWTKHYASLEDIARWRAEPDYGICLQTRWVRALDIDVEDRQLCERIRDSHGLLAGLPCRVRVDSGKCLLFFHLAGEYTKRILRIDGGLIEFLANGQQFIIAGTHTGGARYEIEGGWPDEIPTLTVEEFEELWRTLVETFGIHGVASASPAGFYRLRNGLLETQAQSHALTVHDDFLPKLEVLSYGSEGQAFIRCPFAEEHTSESGESATCYFPRGSRGYEQGHFKCLHAHCAERTDEDFIEALGLYNPFEPLVPVGVGVSPHSVDSEGGDGRHPTIIHSGSEVEKCQPRNGRPKGMKIARDGAMLAVLENLEPYLSDPAVCGDVIQWDSFCCGIMWYPWGIPSEVNQWRPFTDDDYTRLRIRFGRDGFQSIPKEMIRDAVRHVATRNPFDSAITWLESLAWDGVSRVGNFLNQYFGTEGSAYTRAVSAYMWTAMAGRVLKPGVQADMVPVFVGIKQGERKTSGVRELVVSPEHFETISLCERDADLTRKMLGKLVLEIGELHGFHSRDAESIKDFITRRHDTWVPKYIEYASTAQRRSIFIGSTNSMEFLADTTGNRRWLPVETTKLNIEKLQADRVQLWAEAATIFKASGVAWQKAEGLAPFVHSKHRISDVWHEFIGRWLTEIDDFTGKLPSRDGFTLGDVLAGAMGLDKQRISRVHEHRATTILRELGYERKQDRIDGIRGWYWYLPLC